MKKTYKPDFPEEFSSYFGNAWITLLRIPLPSSLIPELSSLYQSSDLCKNDKYWHLFFVTTNEHYEPKCVNHDQHIRRRDRQVIDFFCEWSQATFYARPVIWSVVNEPPRGGTRPLRGWRLYVEFVQSYTRIWPGLMPLHSRLWSYKTVSRDADLNSFRFRFVIQ